MIDNDHTNYLNFDVHLDQLLRERIDLDKTRIHGTVKATKFGDKTNIALVDRSIWIWTDNTAWNRAECSNAGSEGID